MVVTVSESLRDIYISDVKVDPDKIVNLPNSTELSVFKYQNTDNRILEKYKDRFILFYAGGLDHLRGIEFICQAVSVLVKKIPEVLFVLAGKENRAFSMEETIKRFGIKDHVDFVGWIHRSELPSYIAASHVCLFVPKADNMEINNTIVTKIYQYTAMGKPVVVSEARMMKEFVEKNRIGFSVDFGDVDQFCNIIRKIWDTPDLSIEIKRNASSIRHLISWEETSRDFLKYYIEMVREMLNTFKSVAKGTVIYGFANVSIKLLGIILIPIYTNYKYLSKADFGVLGVLDTTYQLVIIVLGLSLYQSFARWYYDPEHKAAQKSMYFTVIIVNALICITLS